VVLVLDGSDVRFSSLVVSFLPCCVGRIRSLSGAGDPSMLSDSEPVSDNAAVKSLDEFCFSSNVSMSLEVLIVSNPASCLSFTKTGDGPVSVVDELMALPFSWLDFLRVLLLLGVLTVSIFQSLLRGLTC
jgi:hypothetical protein